MGKLNSVVPHCLLVHEIHDDLNNESVDMDRWHVTSLVPRLSPEDE